MKTTTATKKARKVQATPPPPVDPGNRDHGAEENKRLGLPYNAEPMERVYHAMDLRTLEVLEAHVNHEHAQACKRRDQAEGDVHEASVKLAQLRRALTRKRGVSHPLNVKVSNGHQ